MQYADIHIHLLSGADDGADSDEMMKQMLDAAYADGTRVICATPHYHPGYFGSNSEASQISFEKLKVMASDYTDLKLYLGNELRFSPNCLGWLEKSDCRTLNGGRYVLCDFSENEDADKIVHALKSLLNSGHIPILAHAERYSAFHRDLRELWELSNCGVLIQVDAHSVFGEWGHGAARRCKKILDFRLADIAASDAHNVSGRPPQLSKFCEYVTKKYGSDYAKALLWDNPMFILNDRSNRKDNT